MMKRRPLHPEADPPFQVGDAVTIFLNSFGRGEQLKLVTVARALKQYVVLSDDSTFKYNGRTHPRTTGYRQPRIERTTEAHRASVEFAKYRRRVLQLSDTRYVDARENGLLVDDLSIEQLRAIVEILDSVPSGTV